MFDVIIVGGGPAGLSAALVLARCCRSVVVFDDGRPRNYASSALHGFLSRDGMPPGDLLAEGREELAAYGVQFRHETARRVEKVSLKAEDLRRFVYRVQTLSGELVEGRKVLLATGVRDHLPEITGAEQFFGRGLYHCPYCDAYEHRGGNLAALGGGERAVQLAVMLRQWSDSVTLCTETETVGEAARERLLANGIRLVETHVVALEGKEEAQDILGTLRLSTGEAVPCEALFFVTGQFQACGLGRDLGCECSEKEQIVTHEWYDTSVYGCYCAGDAGGRDTVEVQLIVQAAADGATAAIGINQELAREDEEERLKAKGLEGV